MGFPARVPPGEPSQLAASWAVCPDPAEPWVSRPQRWGP